MENEINEHELPKSKSQIKREMLELQELGERLVSLNLEQLKKLALPASLHQAILDAKKMTSRNAKRRQLQYIGRLMRDIEDPTFIKEFFYQLEMKDQRANAFLHMLESWRERLLSDDVAAQTEFIQLYPNVDRQHLRQLIQNGKKERLHGKPLGASKLLFRYLRELQIQKEKQS